jgi:hypothetical protein
VHGETIVPYGCVAPISPPNSTQSRRNAIFPLFCHRRAQVLRAPWPDHSGLALHFSYDVLVALCTREARRGSHLTNLSVIEWERELGVMGSAMCVDRTLYKCASQN